MSKVDIVLQESEKAFLAEETRTAILEGKAEKYMAAVVVIIGFQLTDLNTISFIGKSSWEILRAHLEIIAFLLLGLSLILALWSRRIWEYVSYPRGQIIIDELRDDDINEEEAKIKIAKMYLSAHNTNAGINDKRARYLSYAGIFIVAGFALMVICRLLPKIS